MNNLAPRFRLGSNRADDTGIITIGHKADVLTIGLGRNHQSRRFSQPAYLGLFHAAQGKAQIVKLRLAGAVEKIALVTGGVHGAMQFRSGCRFDSPHIVSRRQTIRAKIPCHRQKVGKFRSHVTADAGDGGAALHIVFGKLLDHALPKAAFVVENIMGNPQPVGHGAGIADVVAGATGTFALDRFAVVIKLKGDADDLCAACRGHGRHHRTVDTARHGDNDPPIRQWRC